MEFLILIAFSLKYTHYESRHLKVDKPERSTKKDKR